MVSQGHPFPDGFLIYNKFHYNPQNKSSSHFLLSIYDMNLESCHIF